MRTNRSGAQLLARLADGERPRIGSRLAEPLRSIVRATIKEDASERHHVESADGSLAVYVTCARLQETGAIALGLCVHRAQLDDADAVERLAQRHSLSVRDRQVIALLQRGMTNRMIAEELRLTESTVKSYLHQLYCALHVHSRTELLALLQRTRFES